MYELIGIIIIIIDLDSVISFNGILTNTGVYYVDYFGYNII